MSKPDWEFWRHVPELELWQAVCLSQDAEPDEHDQEDVACEDFFRGNETASRRLRLLAANLVPRGKFSRFIIDYEDPHKSKVRLSEFSTWAVSVVEWEGLPPELLALARALPNAENTAAQPALVEAREQPDAAHSGAPDDDGERADALTPTDDDHAAFAELFDPVKVTTLEALFPDSGQWGKYAERAARNGLSAARTGRGVFNPYRAAVWWISSQGPHGWKWDRCLRVLAKNLPARSRDSMHLLTGEFD
ncbi:hypothetical protein [Accumulibacter sp.]|uniref:hypothetical protein n=1 Tax=Accumulibacter sp. TaxID=2053492 RepID=UPI0025862755|nr:hypothetical protein [Accumulibacter sp.]